MADTDDGRMGELLARRAAARSGAAAHPSEESWEALACGELPPDELERLLEHVRSCSACLRVHRALTLLAPEAAAFDPGAPGAWSTTPSVAAVELLRQRHSTGRLRFAAIAASLLAAALLYPAFLGLERLSDAREAIDAPPAAGLTGAVARLSVLRGHDEQGPPRIAVPAGPGQVVLLVEPALSARVTDGATLRFELLSADGTVAWGTDATAAEIRRGLESPVEAVALIIPAELLAPGRHALRLRDGAGAVLFEAAFDVAR